MFKILSIALLAALVLASPVHADDTVGGVASDVGAVGKDNVALGKDDLDLAADRAAKAKDKATGDWAGQAVDSMKIGYDQMKHTEKGTEKDVDKKILTHDVNSATGN